MTGRERMLHVLGGTSVPGGEVPVTPHWWGLYKFQYGGLISGYDGEETAWEKNGSELAAYDEAFYRRFLPDMLHLTTGGGASDPKRQAEIRRMCSLRGEDLLASPARIDEYGTLLWESAEELSAGPAFRHVPILAERLGGQALLAVNEGLTVGAYFDPGGHMGFERGLIGLLEHPDNTGYFLQKIYAAVLERVRALKQLGCDAYISSETLCSADILSPDCYRAVVFPVQQWFFHEIAALGIIPIAYFTGNILPILEEVKQLGLQGLLVEESKKGFLLEPDQIAERLENTVALFGNLDSVAVMRDAAPREVRAQTRALLERMRGRRFVMSNGCPLAFGTPPENIDAMIAETRRFSAEKAARLDETGAACYNKQ